LRKQGGQGSACPCRLRQYRKHVLKTDHVDLIIDSSIPFFILSSRAWRAALSSRFSAALASLFSIINT